MQELTPDPTYILKPDSAASLAEMPRGVIFAPDLHADVKGPSTRMDNYEQTTISKLAHILDVANQELRVAVFPGDFMGRSRISSDYLKSTIIKLMREAVFRPIIYPGNHDMASDLLSEADSLYLLRASGAAHVQRYSGATATIMMRCNDGSVRSVGIGGTPYGQDIPDVAGFLPPDESNPGRDPDLGLWFTHHNLPFAQHYAEQKIYGFKAIGGVHSVINGHLHHATPSVRIADARGAHTTEWHNPGSVMRTKASERERTPNFGSIDPDGSIDILPLILDGGQSVFTAASGRASAPGLSASISAEARDRLISGLTVTDEDDGNIGILLDEAVANNEIDLATREWLEEIAIQTRPA